MKLNDYIQHFEPLTYDCDLLHQSHLKVKRSLSSDHSDRAVTLMIQAHGHEFQLELFPDRSTVTASTEQVVPSGKIEKADLSHIYSGTSKGLLSAYVIFSCSCSSI